MPHRNIAMELPFSPGARPPNNKKKRKKYEKESGNLSRKKCFFFYTGVKKKKSKTRTNLLMPLWTLGAADSRFQLRCLDKPGAFNEQRA